MKEMKGDAMIYHRARKIRDQLSRELSEAHPDIMVPYPVERYVDQLDRYPAYSHYKYVGPQIREICEKIAGLTGEEILEQYHSLLMVTLIDWAERNPALLNLPQEVQRIYAKNFDRIVSKIEKGNAKKGSYLYSDDKFNKDLLVCRLLLIPLGSQKVYAGRMSRGFLFRGGLSQFTEGLSMVLFETHGFQPVYRMHTDSRDRDLMKEFNPDGWAAFFRRAAELLRFNKGVKALCGSSWFFDPTIVEHSSELAYIRKLAAECGAHFYRQGSTPGAVKDALFMSRKRQQLYDEGKYVPVSYLMVLPRGRIIAWADGKRWT